MVVIVAIAVVVTVAWFAWLDRPRHDSVAEYQRAIETLREIAERPGQIPGERVADAPEFVTTGFGAMVSTRRAIAAVAVLAAVAVAAFAAVDRPGSPPHGLAPARNELAGAGAADAASTHRHYRAGDHGDELVGRPARGRERGWKCDGHGRLPRHAHDSRDRCVLGTSERRVRPGPLSRDAAAG